jgi:hypothetical protein
MTANRDLKRIIRDRQQKTGESYTAARAQVLRDRAALLGADAAATTVATPARADAAVLKVNRQSARVRILGAPDQLTFRSGDIWGMVPVVPGHVVTLVVERRWCWRGDAYASGRIEDPRIDVEKLGLMPLRLTGGELEDLASHAEPYRRSDPYARLWKKLTAKPRPAYEFDRIAWGALPGLSADENPTCDAAELMEAGDDEGAWEILMETLGADLRCLDAHAHLGNLIFDGAPERAIVHYELGMRIGELSLPPGFDGLLLWSQIYNRPFLRCLHGYGLCLWRLGRLEDTMRVFERLLALNPNDNQGVRFCWGYARKGRSWDEMQERDEAERAGRFGPLN